VKAVKVAAKMEKMESKAEKFEVDFDKLYTKIEKLDYRKAKAFPARKEEKNV
jgi:hypothetical protein